MNEGRIFKIFKPDTINNLNADIEVWLEENKAIVDHIHIFVTNLGYYGAVVTAIK